MRNKKVIFVDAELTAEIPGAMVSPDKSFDEAFGRFGGDAISVSMNALHAAMRWIWLRWHLANPFKAISEDLTKVVVRSASPAAMKMRDPDGFRGFHDWVLLACAVLSGHPPTMLTAAEASTAASARAKRNQYFGSLAGILQSRIRGEPKDERDQL